MQERLQDFIRVLRSAGVRISTAEVIDSQKAVQRIGLTERELLREALATTLAKTHEEHDILLGCFERFFSTHGHDEEPAADEDTTQAQPAPGLEAPPGNVPASAPDEAESDVHAPLAKQLLGDEWPALDAAIAAAGQREGINRIASFTQRGRFTRAISDALGMRDMDREIARLEAGGADDRAAALALEQRRALLRERIREHVERHVALFAMPEESRQRLERLPYIKLDNVEQRHYADLRRLVERMARRLAADRSRRLKHTRRGRLDIRRTLRSGLAYDGVPFNPQWRQRRRDRPRVIALCDVSGSVAATARFLLMFLYSMSTVMPRTRSFVFCNETHEVTSLFEHATIEQAVATAVDRYGNQPSNYASALEQFAAQCLDDIDRRTVVVILGDGRSNYADPGVEHLRRVHERARRVIWLNPEPRPMWGYGDSEMPRLASACHVVQTCNTLKHLEHLMDTLLSS